MVVLGEKASGKAVGLLAGLLLAVSPPDIRFAQEVGQYALMVCALIWNLVFLHLAYVRNAWRWWLLWGITATIGLYSYYGAAIVLIPTALIAAVAQAVQGRRTGLLRQVAVGIGCGLLILPLIANWLPTQLGIHSEMPQFQNRPFTGAPDAEVLDLLQRSKDLILFSLLAYQPNGWPWPPLPEGIVWIPVATALSAALVSRERGLAPSVPVWLAFCWLVYYAVARLSGYPFGGRHALILTPLLIVTLAAGIWTLAKRFPIVGTATLGLVVAVGLLAPREPQEDLRSVTQFWASHCQPGEVTYVYYGAALGFRYQLSLLDADAQTVTPAWQSAFRRGDLARYCSHNQVFYGEWIRSLSPDQKWESILNTLGASPERVWLIFSHIHLNEDQVILDTFDRSYSRVLSYEASNAAAY
jgi:uncharacterized membrane protein